MGNLYAFCSNFSSPIWTSSTLSPGPASGTAFMPTSSKFLYLAMYLSRVPTTPGWLLNISICTSCWQFTFKESYREFIKCFSSVLMFSIFPSHPKTFFSLHPHQLPSSQTSLPLSLFLSFSLCLSLFLSIFHFHWYNSYFHKPYVVRPYPLPTGTHGSNLNVTNSWTC